MLSAAFPNLTLFSGQIIKQFESYSLAASLPSVNWNPFATTIPCDGGIRWVLELPAFITLGSLFISALPSWPAAFPLLVFGFFLYSLFLLKERMDPEGSPFPWLAVAGTQAFFRFSTQFLADPLALALLSFGVVFFLGQRKNRAALLFLAAVSVKPTVLPSILFFRWAFTEDRSVLRNVLFAVFFVTPFFLWAVLLKFFQIPSPMHEGGLLAVGIDWGILLEPKFYSKFFVWVVFKGVGVPLVALAAYGSYRFRDDPVIRRLGIWSIGVIPYWFLVRRLNFIHDYYSLSFYLPIALLGALSASRLFSRSWVKILLGVSLVQALGIFIYSGIFTPHLPVSERPVFCGKEFRSESLMGLPPANR